MRHVRGSTASSSAQESSSEWERQKRSRGAKSGRRSGVPRGRGERVSLYEERTGVRPRWVITAVVVLVALTLFVFTGL